MCGQKIIFARQGQGRWGLMGIKKFFKIPPLDTIFQMIILKAKKATKSLTKSNTLITSVKNYQGGESYV